MSEYLFDVKKYETGENSLKSFKPFETAVWTQNKAKFIAEYLKAFTYVTKHGTYIDGFAGPQSEGFNSESWAVKLTLSNQPYWLRNFVLFELDEAQVERLQRLRDSHLKEEDKLIKKRRIEIISGDCNRCIPEFLSSNPLKDREATFCLLDQRSTECDWDTVKIVAEHKKRANTNKIEIFYFLPQGWIDRTLKSWKIDRDERHRKWWGRDDVYDFLKLSSQERGQYMADRFRDELGYKYSYPYPIQDQGIRGRVMFWMIHATDHERAPDLMTQAYRKTGAGSIAKATVQEEFAWS